MADWANSVPKQNTTTQHADLKEVQTVSSGSLTTTKVLIGVAIGTVVFLGISAAVIFTTMALTHTGPFSTKTSASTTTSVTTTSSSLANCSVGVYTTTSGSCTALGTAFNCSSTVNLCGSQASTGGGVFWVGTSGFYDDWDTTATIPFNVSLYRVSSTTIGVSTNGAFSVGASTSTIGSGVLPSSSFSNPTVFLLWQDLAIFSSTTQTIRYGIVGSAPSRMLVVEYYLAPLSSANLLNQMFLVMYEDVPDVVRVEYVYTYNSAAAATVGVQKTGLGPYIQYGYNQAVINNGSVLIYNTYARVYSG